MSPATGVEWGMLVGSMVGASHGFKDRGKIYADAARNTRFTYYGKAYNLGQNKDMNGPWVNIVSAEGNSSKTIFLSSLKEGNKFNLFKYK